MSTGKRLLWLVLLITVVAALWPLPESDTAEGGAARPGATRKRTQVLDAPAAQQLGPLAAPGKASAGGIVAGEIVDLFPRQGWTAPAVSAAPEKPMAPALPFTYGGSYTEGSNILVFLNEGAKMHTVRQGDTVNATYRIEKVAPDAITLTYLPLGQQQILQTGSATP